MVRIKKKLLTISVGAMSGLMLFGLGIISPTIAKSAPIDTAKTETPQVRSNKQVRETGDVKIELNKANGKSYANGTILKIASKYKNSKQKFKSRKLLGNVGTITNAELNSNPFDVLISVQEPQKQPSGTVQVTLDAKLKTPSIVGAVKLIQNPTTGDVTVTATKKNGEKFSDALLVIEKISGPIDLDISGTGVIKNKFLPKVKTTSEAKIYESGRLPASTNVDLFAAKLAPVPSKPVPGHNPVVPGHNPVVPGHKAVSGHDSATTAGNGLVASGHKHAGRLPRTGSEDNSGIIGILSLLGMTATAVSYVVWRTKK